jgi:hypothetical protein
MPWVGFLGHPILSKDKALRYNPLEKKLIILHKLKVFGFSSGNISGEKMATLLRRWLPRMEQMAIKREGPFVASITESGIHLRGNIGELR